MRRPSGEERTRSRMWSLKRRRRRRRWPTPTAAASFLLLLLMNFLAIPNEAMAAAKNELKCEAQEDGSILCRFAIIKPKKGTELTTKMNYCFNNDDGLCLESEVVGKAGNNNTTTKSSQEKLNLKHYESNKRYKRKITDSAAAALTLKHPELLLVSSNVNGTIIVGRDGQFSYKKPYNQYGKEVASVLYKYMNKQNLYERDLYSQAQWLQQLALAYKTRAGHHDLSQELSEVLGESIDIDNYKSFFENDYGDTDGTGGDDDDDDDDIHEDLQGVEYAFFMNNQEDNARNADMGIMDAEGDGDDPDDPIHNNPNDAGEREIKKSLIIFSMAKKIYQSLVQADNNKNSSTDTAAVPGDDTADAVIINNYDAMYGLAGVYFEVSQLYLMSDTLDKTSTRSIGYMMKSEILYRQVAEAASASDSSAVGNGNIGYKDAVRKRAAACYHVGDMIVDEAVEEMDVNALAAATPKGFRGDARDVYTILLRKDVDTIGRLFGKRVKDNLKRIIKAEKYLDDAIESYDDVIRMTRKNDVKRLLDVRWDLAMAWQSKSKASTMRCHLDGTILNGEKAISTYQQVLDEKNKGYDDEVIIEAMADLYLKVAESYLQQQIHDVASIRFEQSMRLHEDNDLFPTDACSSTAVSLWRGDGESDPYVQALEEFEQAGTRNAFYDNEEVLVEEEEAAGAATTTAYTNDGDHTLVSSLNGKKVTIKKQKDDYVYEAELHAGLGTIYLLESEISEAQSHLKKALDLYEQSMNNAQAENTVVTDEILADTEYNLALSYCQGLEYLDGAKMYRQAMSHYSRGNAVAMQAKTKMSSKDHLLSSKTLIPTQSLAIPARRIKTRSKGSLPPLLPTTP